MASSERPIGGARSAAARAVRRSLAGACVHVRAAHLRRLRPPGSETHARVLRHPGRHARARQHGPENIQKELYLSAPLGWTLPPQHGQHEAAHHSRVMQSKPVAEGASRRSAGRDRLRM